MRKHTQWVREMMKYPDHETFAVGDLVLVNHPIRVSFTEFIQEVEQKLDRTSKNTNCPG